jgi:hypothetical protein
MRFARTLMPTLADDFILLRDYTANTGVWPTGIHAPFRQPQSQGHAGVIKSAETH